MELVVEAIAGHGNGLKANGKWYSKDKYCKQAFTDLHPGDALDAEVNDDKFIKTFKIVTAGKPSGSPARASAPSNGYGAMNPDKEASIARAVALKAVFESPIVAHQTTEMGRDEALAFGAGLVKKFEKYLISGSFGE